MTERTTTPTIDLHMARDLELFIENHGDLYRRQGRPIELNLERKLKQRVYDFEKSIKLYMYLVDAGAKLYCTELNVMGKWHHTFPKPLRLHVARELADTWRTNNL